MLDARASGSVGDYFFVSEISHRNVDHSIFIADEFRISLASCSGRTHHHESGLSERRRHFEPVLHFILDGGDLCF